MVASLRRSLILLLLLLQSAAPLLHAHVGEQFQFCGGLHLPALEAFNSADDPQHQALSGHQNDWSQIVELGTAIKLTAIDSAAPMALLPDTCLVVPGASPCLLSVNFSPQPAHLHLAPPFLSANISRAPPF